MHTKFVPAALLLAAGTTHAQDGAVQIDGRLNVALEHAESSTGAGLTRLVNNRSVLGFRGGEDLGGGLKAVFQVEGTLSPDTGAGAIAARDNRVGLAGNWGTLFAGHWTTASTAPPPASIRSIRRRPAT
jgi:predicted porin